MKVVSWNVNGIRSALGKGFLDFVKNEDPDVICVQELKAMPEQVDLNLEGYQQYWNSAQRKGYSGVAVFSRVKPLSIDKGIGILDEEGRVLTLEFEEYFLVTVYTPNSKMTLERLDFRHKIWDKAFLEYVNELPKPVIFCGDLNVAHKEIDLKNPTQNKTTEKKPGNPGFTDKEREGFDKILEAGYIDSFRHFYPEEERYTWWSYMFKARERNAGWRIDYFCVDKNIIDYVEDSRILDHITGSDHCPIVLELKN